MGRTQFPRAGEGGEDPLTAGVQLRGQLGHVLSMTSPTPEKSLSQALKQLINVSGNGRGLCTVQLRDRGGKGEM